MAISVAFPRLCGAETIRETKGAAVLELRYDGARRTIGLADLFTATLSLEGSPQLQMPADPPKMPADAPWLLVERSKLERTDLTPQRVRYRLTYRFGPREPGPSIPFRFPDFKYSDENVEHVVAWTPIAFEVTTTIPAADPGALRDITALEEVPPANPPSRGWLIGLAAGCVALLVVAGFVGVRILMRRRLPRSAAALALYELQRLVAMDLPEAGRSERFITLLTTLVRRYLEKQYGLPARRQTTPEFVDLIEKTERVSEPEKRFLTSFLTRCEAVKFAAATMSPAECAEWAEAARNFLQTHIDSTLQA